MNNTLIASLISRFMGPAWSPSGAVRTKVGPMLAPWTSLSRACLLSGYLLGVHFNYFRDKIWMDIDSQFNPAANVGSFNWRQKQHHVRSCSPHPIWQASPPWTTLQCIHKNKCFPGNWRRRCLILSRNHKLLSDTFFTHEPRGSNIWVDVHAVLRCAL